jgi:transposase
LGRLPEPDHRHPPGAVGPGGLLLDNLNIHLAPELAENTAWLRVYRLPAYAPDLNLVQGIWSLMKRFMANFAAVGHGRIIKRKLKKI